MLIQGHTRGGARTASGRCYGPARARLRNLRSGAVIGDNMRQPGVPLTVNLKLLSQPCCGSPAVSQYMFEVKWSAQVPGAGF